MRTSRPLFGTLLVLGLLVGMGASDSTAAPDITVETVNRDTVEWTLPAGQCPDLADDITLNGTGERLQVVTTTNRPTGRKEIIDNDFVTGTATDNHGNTYSFIYSNQLRQVVLEDGSMVKVSMTDTFVLSGDDSDTSLNVGFVWSWKYRPPNEELWPPSRAWEQHYTLGDPLSCDPI